MIYVWFSLLFFIFIVIGHAFWQAKPQFQVYVADERDAYGWMYQIAFEASKEFHSRLLTIRPLNLLGQERPFTVLHTRGMALHEEVDSLDMIDLKNGDPDGKVRKAARVLAERVWEKVANGHVRAFVKQNMPPTNDFSAMFIEPQTGIPFRVIRFYDVRSNSTPVIVSVEIT